MKYLKLFKMIPSILAFTIYITLLSIGIWGNPFSNNIINGIDKSVDEKELMSNINEDEPYGDASNYEVIGMSERYYMYDNNRVIVVFGKKKYKSSEPFIPIMSCGADQYHIVNIDDEEDQKCAFIDDIKDPNVHPMPPFSSAVMNSQNNFMLLGTIADNGFESGFDRLSYLSNSIFQTTKLSLLSLIVFVMFGLYFSIMIGYYSEKFKLLNNINRFFVKTFESVPIILWVIITIIVFDYNESISSDLKILIYFALFGLFSSPALSNLIIEKINQMKNEDFIVALKLLGLKDRRIIFSHMLKYYCLPIIYFQMAYIMVHSFFLDITLSFIERNSPDILTFGSYIIDSSRNAQFFGNDFNFLIIPSFIIAFVFYKIATFVKGKI